MDNRLERGKQNNRNGGERMKRKISARFFDWITYIGVTIASLFGLA
jgi:hypothetical protein